MVNSKEALLDYVEELKNLVKESIKKKENRKRVLKAKLKLKVVLSFHGHFKRYTKTLMIKDSWLTKDELKRDVETLLVTAQDHVLNIDSVQKCCLCVTEVDNITHIFIACGIITQIYYKCRHDKMACHLHWYLMLGVRT